MAHLKVYLSEEETDGICTITVTTAWPTISTRNHTITGFLPRPWSVWSTRRHVLLVQRGWCSKSLFGCMDPYLEAATVHRSTQINFCKVRFWNLWTSLSNLTHLTRCFSYDLFMIFLSPSPEVGSSKKTTGGFPMSAKQSDSFRFCPPDKAPSIRRTTWSNIVTSRKLLPSRSLLQSCTSLSLFCQTHLLHHLLRTLCHLLRCFCQKGIQTLQTKQNTFHASPRSSTCSMISTVPNNFQQFRLSRLHSPELCINSEMLPDLMASCPI